MHNIKEISKNNKYTFEINNYEFNKINKTIYRLKNKYSKEISDLYNLEKIDSKEYDFSRLRLLINKQKNLIISIINDVIAAYNDELKNIECIFLSGSYARGTNKMSSDIDLHIFYKKGNYNFLYEEIICYIISRIINKSRDCIDPTFILNFSDNYKSYVTSEMSNEKLKITISCLNKKINYSYKVGKKRRFYLQYNNSRDINTLKKYIKREMKKDNFEWLHCFEIIYGKNAFYNIYNKIYNEECSIINRDYIIKRIVKLKTKLNKLKLNPNEKVISKVKKDYQSIAFDIIYEYVSILRLKLLYCGYDVKYINLYEMYDLMKKNNISNNIFNEIYKYIWNLRNLTIYCYDNNINYGLHNYDLIDYSIEKLNIEWERLKEVILLNLDEVGDRL